PPRPKRRIGTADTSDDDRSAAWSQSWVLRSPRAKSPPPGRFFLVILGPPSVSTKRLRGVIGPRSPPRHSMRLTLPRSSWGFDHSRRIEGYLVPSFRPTSPKRKARL